MHCTIKEVARSAGVSFSTAALAFRNPERVKSNTRARVFREAKRLGYEKNRFAAILSSGHGNSAASRPLLGFLAWQQPIEEHQYWVNAKRWADRLNYDLLKINLHGDANPQRTLDIFYARGGSGLFIGPVSEWREIDLTPFALVKLNPSGSSYAAATVHHPVFDETVEAFTQIRRRGYRAILPAIRQHSPRLDDDMLRRGAILACQADLRSDERAIPLLECAHPDMEPLLTAVKRYRPDAVLSFSIGDYFALRDAGFSIPGDLGYANLHHDIAGAPAGVILADISGILAQEDNLMRHAFQLMASLLSSGLRGNEAGSSLTTVSYHWHEGKTLLPIEG